MAFRFDVKTDEELESSDFKLVKEGEVSFKVVLAETAWSNGTGKKPSFEYVKGEVILKDDEGTHHNSFFRLWNEKLLKHFMRSINMFDDYKRGIINVNSFKDKIGRCIVEKNIYTNKHGEEKETREIIDFLYEDTGDLKPEEKPKEATSSTDEKDYDFKDDIPWS